jgi:hypothetical protein
VKLLVVPLKTRVVTDQQDAFSYIDHAVMKDGRAIAGERLRTLLLRAHPRGQRHPETLDANYDTAFEGGIADLVWKPGAVEADTGSLRQVGAWDYDQLDHRLRREVRAVFVLAAWLDEHNMRWENTRLGDTAGAAPRLLHLFSDVGSGMGVARTLSEHRNSDVQSMLWEVTERRRDGSVRFSGFALNVDNEAFERLTWGDARWMLRKMAALSEHQIGQALRATGMSAAEARLALEKLVSKRRRMIVDFGLAGEFPALAARRIDRGPAQNVKPPVR